MSLIYQPGGAALEYAPWALNLYRGCSHGCEYCYVPAATRTTKGAFHSNPHPREVVVRALGNDSLKREAERHAAAHPGEIILLCFTCDPYQPIDEEHQLTRRALEVLTAAGCRVTILTKGKELARRDFDLLASTPGHWFGVTMTGVGHVWEPGAAYNTVRARNIILAAEAGIRTWISFEPTIDPEAQLKLIDWACRQKVNHLAVGRWNHDERAERIPWGEFRLDAIGLMESFGYIEVDANLPSEQLERNTYYIKKALRES